MTDKEKILKYLDSKGISKNKFYQTTGFSVGFLDSGNSLGVDKLKIVLDNYHDLNPDWFFDASSPMIKSKSEETLPKRKLIPFYDTEAEAGTLMVSNMNPVNEPVEWIDAGDWFLDADCAMRVHGDSMFPEYKSGSIVVMREVFDKRLVVFGEDYVIQTNEYKVIKRLMRSGQKGYWLACSVNDETWEKGELSGRLLYEPFDVSIDDVTKLFRVLGCVKRTESSRIVYNRGKK